MVRFCSIPNCPNRSKKHKSDGVSVFSVPFDNPKLLNEWRTALNVTKFGKGFGVCENHFYEEDVKKYCVMKDQKGTVIQTVRYQRSKLAKNCVPKPFDIECRIRHSSHTNDIECSEVVFNTENPADEGFEIEVKKYGDKSLENSSLVFNEISTEDSSNIFIKKPDNLAIHNSTAKKNEKELFFNQLMTQELNVNLPNSSWYKRNSKTGILFAHEEEILISVEKNWVLPTQTKRIFITKDSVKIYFFKKELNLQFANYPSNIRELEIMIKQVDALGICQGGPSIQGKISEDVLLAYKDDNTFRWRHKNCVFFLLEPVLNCKDCQTLFEREQLSQNVKNRPRILGVKVVKNVKTLNGHNF